MLLYCRYFVFFCMSVVIEIILYVNNDLFWNKQNLENCYCMKVLYIFKYIGFIYIWK